MIPSQEKVLFVICQCNFTNRTEPRKSPRIKRNLSF